MVRRRSVAAFENVVLPPVGFHDLPDDPPFSLIEQIDASIRIVGDALLPVDVPVFNLTLVPWRPGCLDDSKGVHRL